MSILRFVDVGREKRAWTAPLPFAHTNVDAVLHIALGEVRKKGRLMSREIDVAYSAAEKRGVVLVGGWRPVGDFTVEDS